MNENEEDKINSLNKNICKLYSKRKKENDVIIFLGKGFLCKLQNYNTIFLITYNHIIKSKILFYKESLLIDIEGIILNIDLSKKRFIYFDDKIGFTLIEIIEINKIYNCLKFEELIQSKKSFIFIKIIYYILV